MERVAPARLPSWWVFRGYHPVETGFRPRGDNAGKQRRARGGAEGDGMRIRWTTRIATAAGLLTLLAGIATGGAPAHAATRPSAVSAVTAAAGYVTGAWIEVDEERLARYRCN